ncbi:MAG TPA: hypothetical protein VJI32_06370 [Candidatus Nanoarchaeia archaeon]|nr:hypothetical protein [Candidatus Nanoarchaeia archaeon]
MPEPRPEDLIKAPAENLPKPEETQEREQRYREAKKKLDDFLEFWGNRGAVKYNQFAPFDEQEICDDPALKDELHTLLENVAVAAMDEDTDISMGLSILESLGRVGEIKTRVGKGIGRKEWPNYDLVEATVRYGTPEQIDTAVSQFYEDNPKDFWAFEWRGIFHKEFQEINTYLENYSRKYNLQYKGAGPVEVNAAQEMLKRNYSLVVSVLWKGGTLPNILEALGQNTRHVEYHRDWKKQGPRWKKIGKDSSSPKRAERILVCEDDAVTGKTLGAVHAFLKRLSPEQLDVCLTSHSLRMRNQLAEELMRMNGIRYDNFFDTAEISPLHLRENIQKTLDQLKMLSQTEPAV